MLLLNLWHSHCRDNGVQNLSFDYLSSVLCFTHFILQAQNMWLDHLEFYILLCPKENV